MSKKWIPVSVCLVVLGGVIGLMQWKASFADENIVISTQQSGTEITIEDTVSHANPDEQTTDLLEEETTTPVTAVASPLFQVEANGALSIGMPDAPITLLEFSSLSCPHCATFHQTSLVPIKKDYIDTGKVKIIFMDFPLNRQALDATLLVRCIETNNRYDFMNMLFEQQGQWAFDDNGHRDKLVQYAALVGMTRDQAESCMNDITSERNLLTNMKMASDRYGVSSTPSFIILPGEQKIGGAQPYGVFSKIFESLLKE